MRKVTANTEIKMISLNCRRVDQNITTTVSHHFELFVCVCISVRSVYTLRRNVIINRRKDHVHCSTAVVEH